MYIIIVAMVCSIFVLSSISIFYCLDACDLCKRCFFAFSGDKEYNYKKKLRNISLGKSYSLSVWSGKW